MLLSLFVLACATSPKDAPQDKRSPAKETSSPSLSEEAPEKELDSKKAAEQEEVTAEKSYKLDEQEKERTKRDLNKLVDELNSIIANREFDKWLDYLTEEYIEYYSDSENLEEITSSPTLTKYGIELRSLRDFFQYVVVASRKNVHIDDIKAIGEGTVKAYMDVDDEPVVVYTLTRVDGRWKITISK